MVWLPSGKSKLLSQVDELILNLLFLYSDFTFCRVYYIDKLDKAIVLLPLRSNLSVK